MQMFDKMVAEFMLVPRCTGGHNRNTGCSRTLDGGEGGDNGTGFISPAVAGEGSWGLGGKGSFFQSALHPCS